MSSFLLRVSARRWAADREADFAPSVVSPDSISKYVGVDYKVHCHPAQEKHNN